MGTPSRVVLVGGGIVGIATAWALAREIDPASITLVEKEKSFASHQSTRNSGVLHSGIYYRPGSRKARFSRRGRERMIQFCRQEGLRLRQAGKLILARSDGDRGQLRDLQQRGQANGVPTQWLNGAELRDLEPRARAREALFVPETAIVDFSEIALRLVEILEAKGTQLLTECRVERMEGRGPEVLVTTSRGPLRTDFLVNCAGLHADRLAGTMIPDLPVRIVPFRGEYFQVTDGATAGLSGRCLYPVPIPGLPFLGVHLTPTVEGPLLAGPNAVLATKLEGYRRGQVSLADMWRVLSYPGFWRLAVRHWRVGLTEMTRSMSRRRFARSLRELVEGIEKEDLTPWPAGVRAQAVTRDGDLVDDFRFEETARTLHVLNAPSPAATASLEIGEAIAGRVLQRVPAA